ncbi:MAG TPA: DUF2842 domain-containing protein [Stellaceae bacterium]|nr:DUF2842 domain-containing protein [Stellaceae bacterium]
MRLRILVGTVVMLVGLAVYGALAMVVATHLPQSAILEFGFYAVAGTAWVAPAALLTRWMARAAPYRPPPGTELPGSGGSG